MPVRRKGGVTSREVIQALEMDEEAVSGVSKETPIDTPSLSRSECSQGAAGD